MANTCNFCAYKDQHVVELTESPIVHEISILDIAAKHFWFTNNELKSFYICNSCRNKLLEFHQFYNQVEKIYSADPEADQIKLEPSAIETDANHTEIDITNIKLETNDIDDEQVIETDVGSDDPEENDCPEMDNKEGLAKGFYRRVTDEDIRLFCQLKCQICSDEFDSFAFLKLHSHKVHNQKSFVDCCGNRYSEIARLQEHILLHIDPSIFRCKVCDLAMSSRRSLLRHRDRVHLSENVKPFQCKMCPKRYAKQYLLNVHLKYNHQPTNRIKRIVDHQCLHCSKEFKFQKALANHLQKVHHVDQNQFICGE
ncbi:transcription factor grauzone-like [Armigeres subalbatus]|uniref:transcription factor grauzone-like n=1 Tax=Armigeres subalbatus TaxID=124917 RepID=UPI002ECFDF36